jgi:glycosyltransferase involved in cell wall biosynthesis
LTQEIARGLVESGHEVVWLAANLPDGGPCREVIDGVHIERCGSELTTRLHAPRLAHTFRPDVIVEEINTLPYFAPLWSRRPVLLHINQLARDVWWYEAPRVLAPIGYVAEPLYLSLYRRTPAVTISPSTRDDLRALGHRAEIAIIPMAPSTTPLERLEPKPPDARLVCIGRLTPSKRVDHAVRALALLRRLRPDARLTVVGDGEELPALRALASSLDIGEAVDLVGRVSEDEKIRVLRQSHVVVVCSVREGWGLTVTEGASQGTPAVAYDIPGVRDAIVDGRTGLLTDRNPEALASSVARLLDDQDLYDRLRESAWREASTLTWGRTAAMFSAALVRAAGANGRAAG